MNLLEKIYAKKTTENGDISYKTTGNNLTDLFFMTSFFEKNLYQVKIGTTDKEKLFSMFVRDPRFGLGRRDLGRRLMQLSNVSAEDIILAGRFDDLWKIPTDNNLEVIKKYVEENNLAKKWMPRLTGKDKMIAKAICEEWNIDEKAYRNLIKTDSTVEYKLSFAEKQNGTELNNLFNKNEYIHPLVEKIDFEKVPSLAMTKYLNCFSTSTENADILGKRIVDNATIGVEMNAIVILDTSGSMYNSWSYGRGPNFESANDIGVKAMSVAHGLAIHSTYAPNQIISFSSSPRLMTIKGDTLKEQYKSMYTGDCSNTDFGKVMKILQGLHKFPEYLIVLSDMEFDRGSNQSKKETMKIFKDAGAETKIIWWNFNDRNKTVPEFDEYGNIYLSGYNLQILKLLENKFDMTTYIDKILEDYKKKINK